MTSYGPNSHPAATINASDSVKKMVKVSASISNPKNQDALVIYTIDAMWLLRSSVAAVFLGPAAFHIERQHYVRYPTARQAQYRADDALLGPGDRDW